MYSQNKMRNDNAGISRHKSKKFKDKTGGVDMWRFIALLAVAIVSFVAGVLVGRKNPKEADRLAKLAQEAKDKIS
jgi:hypothetical protein